MTLLNSIVKAVTDNAQKLLSLNTVQDKQEKELGELKKESLNCCNDTNSTNAMTTPATVTTTPKIESNGKFYIACSIKCVLYNFRSFMSIKCFSCLSDIIIEVCESVWGLGAVRVQDSLPTCS